MKRIIAIFTILFLIPVYVNATDPIEMVIQLGHNHRIISLAFSPDNKFVYSGSYDFTVKLWDIRTGKEVRTYKGLDTWPMDIVVSPDGESVYFCGKEIVCWDTKTAKIRKKIQAFYNYTDDIDITRDGKYLAAGTSGSDLMRQQKKSTIKIWDTGTWELIKEFPSQSYEVYGLSFSYDGKTLATAGCYVDETKEYPYIYNIIIWDVKTGKAMHTIPGPPGLEYAMAYSPNGKYVAYYAKEEEQVKVIEVKSGKKVQTFRVDSLFITNIKFSPRGNSLLYSTFSDDFMTGYVTLSDVESGELIINGSHDGDVLAINFSADGKYIASGDDKSVIKVWDIQKQAELVRFEQKFGSIYSVALTHDKKSVFAGSNEGRFRVWDINNLRLQWWYKGEQYYSPVFYGSFSQDGSSLVVDTVNNIRIFDTENGKERASFEGKGPFVLLPGGNRCLYLANKPWDDKYWFTIGNIQTGKMERHLDIHTPDIDVMDISPDGKYIATSIWNTRYLESAQEGPDPYHTELDYSTVFLWDLVTEKKVWEVSANSVRINSISFLPDGNSIGLGGWLDLEWVSQGTQSYMFFNFNPGYFVMWDTIQGPLESWQDSIYDTDSSISDFVFSHNGNKVYTAGKNIRLRNLGDVYDYEQEFTQHKRYITSLDISPDEKYLVSGSNDTTVRLLNLENNQSVSLVSDGDEWLIFTDDGYYDCSRNGGQFVAIVQGMNVFNIDQFAAKYNRPDIILKRMELGTPEMINHYYRLYKKRLKKLNIRESQLTEELHVPQVIILNIKQENKRAIVQFNVKDEKYKVKRYLIYVNDVPVYGAYGKEISKKNITLKDEVELTAGENKIEITCINEKGAESYRALAYVQYSEKTRGSLYFLGFGVSKYKDKKLNLKYADKDVLDLAQLVSKMKTSFDAVHVQTCTNEQVTPQAIKDSKKFLSSASVDDTFILFISGHGVHDTDAEAAYYFLTYNADIKNLKKTCANFEFIEDLLQDIKPRNKLFLMDTCESGEIDETTQNQYFAMSQEKGFYPRTTRGVILQLRNKSAEKRSYLLEKNRYIYNDLIRRSGAIVFSSCRGDEFSYESDFIKNGFFTEEILNAFSGKEADIDKDGFISTDELRAYVSIEVSQATNGYQHPTIDRDNIYQRFRFPVVP